MKNKRTSKKREPESKLRAGQVAFYVFMAVLVAVSALFGAGCLVLDYMLQGAVVLVTDIVLALFLAELVRMDRKANKKKRDGRIGAVLTTIRDVSVKWSDGRRDFATVELCEEGMAIRGEKGERVDMWVAVSGYEAVNDRQLRIAFGPDDSCVVTCNSDLKCAAAASVLAEHVAEVLS